MKHIKLLPFLLTVSMFAENVSYGQSQPKQVTLESHVELLAPKLRDHYDVAGIAIMVLEEGDIAFTILSGDADRAGKTPVKPSTVFNVGSISKPMTAWGIMHLVKEGKIDLDKPVNRYLKSVKLHSDSIDTDKVTVRQLLSHTAGLSLSAVPEYSSENTAPDLTSYLKESKDLYFQSEAGTEWSYSGGGYMILQQVIEDITGKKFHRYMANEIMKPLGMPNSGFVWTPELKRNAAVPYERGKSTEYFMYTGQAAASLNSTLDDMGNWLKTTLSLHNGNAFATDVIDPETLQSMLEPAPATQRQFGLRYGLGYELWPMGNNNYLTGHNGQNTGWTSGLWFNPVTGDGLIVLINDSHGYNTWRWIFCDWIYWTTKISWRGICTDRPEKIPAIGTSRG